MSTLHYCGKQAKAMGEYVADRAQAKRDAAIEAEESRDEQIANYAHELATKRIKAMEAIDIVAGLQSITEAAAGVMRAHVLAGDTSTVGTMTTALIKMYIEQDSEIMALDWMHRIDAEVAKWGVQ